VISKLGLDYNSIHACENDCILFQGEYENFVICPICKTPRYKDKNTRRRVLRRFPLGPRIEHMFRTPKLAKLMTWHSTTLQLNAQIPAYIPTKIELSL
jgi:hypothetical protein